MFEEKTVNMHTISEEWLRKHRTERGGWTRKQFEVLKIAWPPHAGWIPATVGKEISDKNREKFEKLAVSE